MRFIVEKSNMVTKFVDGHPCLGGKIYDSDNMPYVASIGKTVIKRSVLEAMSSKYPEIKIFTKEEEPLIEPVLASLSSGKIPGAYTWKELLTQHESLSK